MSTAEQFEPLPPSDPTPTIRLFVPAPADQPPPPPVKKSRTLEQCYEKLVKPKLLTKNRAKSTIQDIERALKRWREYWTAAMEKDTRMSDPCVLSNVRIRHLERWQTHLAGEAHLAPPTVNRYLGAIRQVLIAAEDRGLLRRRPKVERLATRAAPKFYMRAEQVAELWPKADGATWPRSPGLAAGDWWRCAFVLYWVYGFRTQELIAFQSGKRALTWSAISLEAETPNPEGTATNALGWLTYVPQKQSWAKPQPLYLPLIPATRAAVDRLAEAARVRTGELRADDPIFPLSSAHKSLYREWRAWQKRASVTNKAGKPFLLKSLRKSAATYLEKHRKGLGAAVGGWAGRESSKVMENHYAVNELELVEQMATYPSPECFMQLAAHTEN